jgi:DNA topoisomerase-1
MFDKIPPEWIKSHKVHDLTTNSKTFYVPIVITSRFSKTTNAAKKGGASCGIGPGGFQPGNKCAKGGSRTSKQAAADAKFDKLMESKSPTDAKAFRAARKDGINIPPAWTNVTYHGADKDIRAEGRDSKGRKQRAENPDYRARLSLENNARISKDLTPRMSQVRDKLREGANSGNEEDKVLYLITETGFRIGSTRDTKAKSQAYGASTLKGEHVKIDGSKVTFDFPGKKGVRQQHTVDDPVIADMFKGAKPGERVFSTNDNRIRDRWKDAHGGKKVHDIRHAVATEKARKGIDSRIPPVPKTKRDRARLMKDVGTEVASVLGNNASQALGTYIDPAIWDSI